MLDQRTMLTIFGGIALLVILTLVSCARRQSSTPKKSNLSETPGTSSPSKRLRELSRERSDYSIFVGVPLSSPTKWAEVTRINGDSLVVKGHGTVLIPDIKAFIVAYPNGQLVDGNTRGLPLPKGFTGLSPSAIPDRDILQLSDLKIGKQFLKIKYGKSPSHPNDRSHYSTSLVNITNERIKVNRFAAYIKTNRGWRLSTITKKFFSAQEFQEWYGLGSNPWIMPMQAVGDPNNYGAPPILWAYYCETESGKQFIAGAILQ